jgi:hypothetical protein
LIGHAVERDAQRRGFPAARIATQRAAKCGRRASERLGEAAGDRVDLVVPRLGAERRKALDVFLAEDDGADTDGICPKSVPKEGFAKRDLKSILLI